MILFIKLLLVHMVGDFLLQPTSWVLAKEERKWKAYQLYVHIILHGVLAMVLVWDWNFWPWALLIVFSHGIIDITKLILQNDRTKRYYFFADQLAHFVSLYLIYFWYVGYTRIDISLFSEDRFLLLVLIVFLTFPSSVIIKMFIAKWSPHTALDVRESLEDAGKYIGIFERLFVFIFVIGGNWEAIGFLLTAKSVFRFGDLKESKDRQLTEYILIGTLLSFGISVVAGMIYTVYAPAT